MTVILLSMHGVMLGSPTSITDTCSPLTMQLYRLCPAGKNKTNNFETLNCLDCNYLMF